MCCYWEQMGSLGPIYRLLGEGLNDREIAKELNFSELNVQSCVVWMLHFIKMRDRQELVVYALAAA
jgi:DNA-binding NarL/FixJ family response regulator